MFYSVYAMVVLLVALTVATLVDEWDVKRVADLVALTVVMRVVEKVAKMALRKGSSKVAP